MATKDQKADSKKLADFINSLDPQSFDKTLLNDAWLKSQPQDRLIEVIKVLAAWLKGESTAKIKKSDLPAITDEAPVAAPEPTYITDEVTVPASQRALSDNPDFQWELLLLPKEKGHRPLQIKILGDFTIGRRKGEKAVDLDLSSFDAAQMGVSGQHAAIRVAPDGLYLVDLSSTNGTYYQYDAIELGNPMKLTEGAVISFSKLVFLVSKITKLK